VRRLLVLAALALPASAAAAAVTHALGGTSPAETVVRVVLERRTRVGASWQAVKSVATDGLGRFYLSVLPGRSGEWRARIGDLRSSPTPLTVAPQLHIETGAGTAFLGAPVVIHTRPRANLGVRITVLRGGREAFQKARGLERTGAVDASTWRALAQDVVPTPRRGVEGNHIEVSKSRQILMVVRDGETVWYLPVSSGTAGITPVGNYRILWKALATTTWLGPAILYRTMTFHTHYAIHGFASVPTYPASHGCVRIPIWLADWLYQHSPVGEPVYVYE
jgi:L,D-transpeptidase catalytic domain